jgi:hypothetical protein
MPWIELVCDEIRTSRDDIAYDAPGLPVYAPLKFRTASDMLPKIELGLMDCPERWDGLRRWVHSPAPALCGACPATRVHSTV